MRWWDFVKLYLMWRNEPESLRPLNLYAVWEEEPGFFRSAQPNPADLSWLIGTLGLRSVLVLRRGVEEWERTAVTQAGLTLHHVSMSATRAPSADEVARLLEVAATAGRPLLTHCQGGADRTGVWSFLVRFEVLGLDRETALRALSARYFHLPEVNAETRLLREWARQYQRREAVAGSSLG